MSDDTHAPEVELPDAAGLRELAGMEPPMPVLSVYLDTDPRDPANTAATPAWHVTLTNGVRDAGTLLEAGEDRDARLAFRTVGDEIVDEVAGLTPEERGRSLVLFRSLDGSVSRRFVSQLPVTESVVRLDARPYVSPLPDLLARGRTTGVVLVSGERVRVLAWADGWIDEATDVVLESGRDQWRPYRGTAASHRSGHGATHVEHFEAREENERDRFLITGAEACAQQLTKAGWRRVVLAADAEIAARFRDALSQQVRERIVLELDANLVGAASTDVAHRLEPELATLHRDEVAALAAQLLEGEAVGAGASVAAGPGAVLAALAERRVEQLVLDPAHVPSADDARSARAETVVPAGTPPELIGERAVEAALASGAGVFTVSVDDAPPLGKADGMVARLRW